MTFPGKAHLADVPETREGPWTYKVWFENGEDITLEADAVEWEGNFLRFYLDPSENESFLVRAFRSDAVWEVRELTPSTK